MRTTILFLILGVLPFGIVHPANPAQTTPTSSTHYIVFRRDAAGMVEPVFYRQVNLLNPLQSSSPAELNSELQAARNERGYVAALIDRVSGRTLYESVTSVPEWIRGEFHKDGPLQPGESNIDGHYITPAESYFVVRAPVLPETNLTVQTRAAYLGDVSAQSEPNGGRFDFDPTAITSDPAIEEAVGNIEQPVQAQSSDPANRVDLLIMGDGFTSAQNAAFNTAVANFQAEFFSISPYYEYRNYVNVISLFTASAQSGADHPPYNPDCTSSSCCSDSDAYYDSLSGTYVNTTFNATYCTNQIHRLLTVNGSLIYAAAAAVPDWDEILVIVNDTTYGGAGGAFGTFSTNMYAVEIAQHEYGHSFAKLGDEYESPYPGYPSCTDTDASTSNDCQPNVTNRSTSTGLKWLRWVNAPVPTPLNNPSYQPSNIVGLFQGARYSSTDYYRPGYACIMRYLGYPYCPVPSEAYALRLYNGGWGTPASGISLLEPGTFSPAGTSAALTIPDTLIMSAGLLGPDTTPSLRARWYVNNVLVSDTNQTTNASYSFSPITSGTYTIRLDVTDVSGIIHPTMQDSSLSSRTWTVTASTPLPPNPLSPANNAMLDTRMPIFSWSALPNMANYEIQLDTQNPLTTLPIQVNETSFTPDILMDFGTYYWRARGYSNSGNYTPWSTVQTLTLASPLDAAPQPYAYSIPRPPLTWNRMSSAVEYVVQVATSTAFTDPLTIHVTLPASRLSYTPTADLAEGSYFWRVGVRTTPGGPITWSAVLPLLIDLP